ncbi:hypothetical protein [Mesorhizobium sp. M1365]
MQLVASQHLAESLFPHHDKMPFFDNFQAGTMGIVSASDRRKIQAFS